MATCTITGTLQALDGEPIVDAVVRAWVEPTGDDQSGQVAGIVGVGGDPIVAFTDAGGSFLLRLVQGARGQLEIPAIALRKAVTVPRAPGPIDFAELI